MNAYIWPVVVSSIVAIIIGSLWYSPLLFGKTWIALMGWDDKTMEEMKNRGMWGSYVGQLIFSLISFGVLAFFITETQTAGWLNGAVLGFVVWLGFVLPQNASAVFWQNEKLKLTIINTCCSLVSLVVGGAILASWMV